MAASAQVPALDPPRDLAEAGWFGAALGLRLESDLPAPGLAPGHPGPHEPDVLLRRASAAAIDRRWRGAEPRELLERRHPDGTVGMWVGLDPMRGYRVDAPGFGRFLIDPGGSLIECAPAPGASWRWCRPLFAQALALAAVANGVELLHASVVGLDGRVLAFAGPSGAGKTSLAVHMVDRGASVLADDALAMAPGGERLEVHPGPRLANVAEEQFEALSHPGRARLGRVLGRSDKLHLELPPVDPRPRPLSALYLLDRNAAAERLAFERLWAPDPRLLLSATSLPHVAGPVRLAVQLDVCSQLALTIPCFRLLAPVDLGPAALSRGVAAHCATL